MSWTNKEGDKVNSGENKDNTENQVVNGHHCRRPDQQIGMTVKDFFVDHDS